MSFQLERDPSGYVYAITYEGYVVLQLNAEKIVELLNRSNVLKEDIEALKGEGAKRKVVSRDIWTLKRDALRDEIIDAEGTTICDWDHRGRSQPPNEEDGKLMAAAPRILDALDNLHTWQNGPPLLCYEKQWQQAMDETESIMEELGRTIKKS